MEWTTPTFNLNVDQTKTVPDQTKTTATAPVTLDSFVAPTWPVSEKVFAVQKPTIDQSRVAKEKQAFTTYEKKPVKKSNGSDDDDFFEEGPGFPVSVSSLFITVFGVLAVVFYYSYSYLSIASQIVIEPKDQAFVSQIQWREQTLNSFVPLNDFALYDTLSFSGENASQNINDIIQTNSLNYIHKRNLTYKATHEIANSINQEKEAINQLRASIAEYGFFDPELAQLMESSKNNVSIQESLSSLETVRFATAIKVFSFLDNFTAPFIRQSGKSKEYVSSQLKLFVDRWEVDISNYLRTCRNNPFERIDWCNIIGDFRNYFNYIEPREDFDIDLFLQLITLADQKLEEEEFPSLSLLFDRFNPNSQKLSFTVNVNTTTYDRTQLQAVWIFAPQVFIITNLVNLLKQSKFVLWSDININKLEVQKKNINVWGNTDQIYTSTMRFELPLQKSTQREIFDFEFKENVDNIAQTFNLDLWFTLPSGQEVQANVTGELLNDNNKEISTPPVEIPLETNSSTNSWATQTIEEFSIETIEQ